MRQISLIFVLIISITNLVRFFFRFSLVCVNLIILFSFKISSAPTHHILQVRSSNGHSNCGCGSSVPIESNNNGIKVIYRVPSSDIPQQSFNRQYIPTQADIPIPSSINLKSNPSTFLSLRPTIESNLQPIFNDIAKKLFSLNDQPEMSNDEKDINTKMMPITTNNENTQKNQTPNVAKDSLVPSSQTSNDSEKTKLNSDSDISKIDKPKSPDLKDLPQTDNGYSNTDLNATKRKANKQNTTVKEEQSSKNANEQITTVMTSATTPASQLNKMPSKNMKEAKDPKIKIINDETNAPQPVLLDMMISSATPAASLNEMPIITPQKRMEKKNSPKEDNTNSVTAKPAVDPLNINPFIAPVQKSAASLLDDPAVLELLLKLLLKKQAAMN